MGYTVSIELKNNIVIYVTSEGDAPFIEWLESLDKSIRARIKERLDRVALGNMGDCEAIIGGKGIWELKFSFGSGYRIYYARDTDKLVLLLSGGNKSTQAKDIKKAIRYWADYLER